MLGEGRLEIALQHGHYNLAMILYFPGQDIFKEKITVRPGLEKRFLNIRSVGVV